MVTPDPKIRKMGRIRGLAIGGLAWSGVVLGHLAAYLLAYPSEPERSALLANTGHGSFPILFVSGLAAIPAVLTILAVRVIRGDRTPALVSTAMWLAAIQVPAFLTMEFFERGMSFGAMLLEPALLIGIVVQVVVAFVSAVLVRVFFRAVAILTSRGWKLSNLAPPRVLGPVTQALPRRLDFLIRAHRRAPPLTSGS
jgi:hypothetical protein